MFVLIVILIIATISKLLVRFQTKNIEAKVREREAEIVKERTEEILADKNSEPSADYNLKISKLAKMEDKMKTILFWKYFVGMIFLVGLFIPGSPWNYQTVKAYWAQHKDNQQDQLMQDPARRQVMFQCYFEKIKEAGIVGGTSPFPELKGRVFYDDKDKPKVEAIRQECLHQALK